jgi:hypothetical protein
VKQTGDILHKMAIELSPKEKKTAAKTNNDERTKQGWQ